MKLTRLTPADGFEVRKWLEDTLDLTVYQKERLIDDDLIRQSPFYFYKKREKPKINLWWRLTIIFIPAYYLILLCLLPFNFLFTGQWGYGKKFYDTIHASWMNKLNL